MMIIAIAQSATGSQPSVPQLATQQSPVTVTQQQVNHDITSTDGE